MEIKLDPNTAESIQCVALGTAVVLVVAMIVAGLSYGCHQNEETERKENEQRLEAAKAGLKWVNPSGIGGVSHYEKMEK